MEQAKTNQPTIGTWDKLPTEEPERKPKVEFEVNSTKDVIFVSNDPKEFQGDSGAYYLFDVEENQQPKVVMTSAWSLLKSLKIFSPLAGKRLKITKKLDKGKQHFEVEEIK